jgi:hypothetical protein
MDCFSSWTCTLLPHIFTHDEEFSSSSAAAAVVHVGHAKVLIVWKNRPCHHFAHLMVSGYCSNSEKPAANGISTDIRDSITRPGPRDDQGGKIEMASL